MAKHRRPRDPRPQSRPRRRAARIRSGALALTIASCLVGSLALFVSASAAGGGSAANIAGARHGKLTGPSRRSRHSRQPAASPASPGPEHVSGESVTAVGDSIMVASTPAMQAAVPGIYIDAVVGRQFGTGLQVIADLKARGLLRPIVVVGLGTNGPVTADQISQLFAEIGPDRRLILVNTFEARPWEHEVNSTLATAAGTHRGVMLADWYTTIEHRTALLW